MSNLLFLNIGHDISSFAAQLITGVDKARAESPVLKIVLWPARYALVIIKVFTNYAAQGATQMHQRVIPETITNVRSHLMSATPNSIYCFNKTGFLIFFTDMYFICFYYTKIVLRADLAYIYLLLKTATIAMPYLFLMPAERVPFWILGGALTLVECFLGLWMIVSWGYGINWENDHFYHHWKKHYRYRYASGNRQLTVELSTYIYVIAKLLILNDYFCYNEATRAARLATPHTPTKGSLDFDLDYLTALLEQDSLAALRYGALLLITVLFLTIYIKTLTPTVQKVEKASKAWNSKTGTSCALDGILTWQCLGTIVVIMVVGIAIGTVLGPEATVQFVGPGVATAIFCAHQNYQEAEAAKAAKAAATAAQQPVPTASHTPTKGSLDFDLDYLTALLEQDSLANLRYGILFLLALSSLGVYSIILAGWSSNSKYAFIGALRSAAQMISYEVAISLIILPVVLLAGSLNLTMITYIQNITVWFLWPLLPISILFLIAMLAETNRTPFDLPEAEAELVAGYNVDYSSLPFAMFFLGEYCNMILISTLYCILFLGGGLNSLDLSSALLLSFKAAITWIFFVLVRATLPRYRYDQLMDIGWKVFLPVAGAFLLFVFGLLVYFDALPAANELPLVGNSVAPLFIFLFVCRDRTASNRSFLTLRENDLGPLTEMFLVFWAVKALLSQRTVLDETWHFSRPLWSQYADAVAQKAAAEDRLFIAQEKLEMSTALYEQARVNIYTTLFHCCVLIVFVVAFSVAVWYKLAPPENANRPAAAVLQWSIWLVGMFGAARQLVININALPLDSPVALLNILLFEMRVVKIPLALLLL